MQEKNAFSMMKKFLTSKEAAEYLAVPEDELQKMASEGKVPSYQIGGIYLRFRIDDLDSYCRKARKGSKDRYGSPISDRIKDFFYFNNFYIFACIVVIIILYFIFKY